MAKFVLLYHGGSPPADDGAKDRMMAAWGQWMEGLGDALVEGGNPLGPPRSIGGEAGDPANGYSIIEASDHEAAMQLAGGNPMAGDELARIDVHEMFSM